MKMQTKCNKCDSLLFSPTTGNCLSCDVKHNREITERILSENNFFPIGNGGVIVTDDPEVNGPILDTIYIVSEHRAIKTKIENVKALLLTKYENRPEIKKFKTTRVILKTHFNNVKYKNYKEVPWKTWREVLSQ